MDTPGAIPAENETVPTPDPISTPTLIYSPIQRVTTYKVKWGILTLNKYPTFDEAVKDAIGRKTLKPTSNYRIEASLIWDIK